MTQDMTKGKIMPMLIRFTIPLVLGNLFQLTYNAVDSIIVGHFIGKRGTGCGRYLQSGHDIGHSVSEWSVHWARVF